MKRKSKSSNAAPEDFSNGSEISEPIRQSDWSEEKLRRWEIQMRLVTDALPALISYVDAERRYQFVNQTYTDWFGHAPEEIVGKHIAEVIGEAAYAGVLPEMERVFAGEAFSFERLMPYKDGGSRFVAVNYVPDKDESGAVRGFYALIEDISERKQSEEKINQLGERNREILESISDGFFALDLDWRFTYVNSQTELILDKKSGDLLGNVLWDVYNLAGSEFEKAYHRTANEGVVSTFTAYFPDHDRWYEVNAYPASNGITVFFKNATEQKRREANLAFLADITVDFSRQSSADEIMRAVGAKIGIFFNISNCLFAEIDETADKVVVESVWQTDGQPSLVGVYQLSEFVTEEFQQAARGGETIVIRDTQTDSRTDAAAYAAYNIGSFVTVPCKRAGVWKFLLTVNDSAARDWREDEIELIQEITSRVFIRLERARAEENLRESEQQLHTLADSIPQLAWMAEPDGFIFWYNRRWYDYTGTTPEEMAGWGWQTVHDQAMLPKVLERWQASIETGEPFEMEFPLRRGADKLFRWFLTRVVPLRDSNGRIVRWFGTNTDIEEVRQARLQAEQANRLKDEFLATLSHELRTPLNAILGWSKVLQSHNLDESEREKALSTIERSARSQNQLIEDILDVSRIITGKLRLDVRAVDLSSVITAAIDVARPAAEAKNIRLQVLLDPQAGPISGDPDRLQQVVWNLLSNAVKFTTKGGRIQVRLERVNSHVEIVISDTGKGIEPEFLPHVFDRFRQSDGSMTRRHGGLGLGLAIVRQIVELHGGTVSVMSDGEEKGATFTISLPLLPVRRDVPSDVPRVHPTAQSAVGAKAEIDCPPELTGLRVLLVDDEADSRDLLSLVLDSCGAEVVTANSAAEAFAAIGAEKFDILISDIGMPDEDGFSLIKRIRGLPDEQGGSVPAIALTAYARSEDRVRAIRSGFQMHVAKPVEPAELVAVAANLAGRMRNPKRGESE